MYSDIPRHQTPHCCHYWRLVSSFLSVLLNFGFVFRLLYGSSDSLLPPLLRPAQPNATRGANSLIFPWTLKDFRRTEEHSLRREEGIGSKSQFVSGD
jgi:hypothetical protein